MMVTFISQCEKKALDKTRRVLDAFANRIGDRTWQTVITDDGLAAVKKLLRKTASKNTAVSCHWIRSRSRSELQWIVGNKDKFNNQGIVPVNYTNQADALKMDEIMVNITKYLANTKQQPLDQHLFAVGYLAHETIIRLTADKKLATAAFVAGCLHDIGKIDPGFQNWILAESKKKTQKEIPEEGQHIDNKTGKFSFEQHPRHNEISLLLYHLLNDESYKSINKRTKDLIKHTLYWHHAKPIRKVEFKTLDTVYQKLKNNIGNAEFSMLIHVVKQMVDAINTIAEEYFEDEPLLLKGLFKQFDDDKIYELSEIRFPNYKHYRQNDHFKSYKEDILTNSKLNLCRAAVISADRQISSKSTESLASYIEERNLQELLNESLNTTSNLSKEIETCLQGFEERYPDSERNADQSIAASKLADLSGVAVLNGPAGCGKTKIALEWALKTRAKKIIWVCPRVQVCQGLITDLTNTEYLHGAKIEINTGEFKILYQAGDKHDTPDGEEFSGDVVVTTIDQIINTITTHTKVTGLVQFMNAHVVFDEYHEYIPMPAFNLLFAELVACKQLQENKGKALLVSATPNYHFVQELLGLEREDIIGISSFNQSKYKINFAIFKESEQNDNNPLFEQQPENTIVISNTAITAQRSFIYNQHRENAILMHSKYIKSDQQGLFNKTYNSFKKDGDRNYAILRSGPVAQASLNITCNKMITEFTLAENWLQRLGRLDRFGENTEINQYIIAIPDSLAIGGKQMSRCAKFLNSLHSLQSAKVWNDFLQNEIEDREVTINELYQLYEKFYETDSCLSAIEEDLLNSLKKSTEKIAAKLLDPVTLPRKTMTKDKKIKIKKHSLRGDNRFVQMAVCRIDNLESYEFVDAYAYDETDLEANLTYSVEPILGYGDSRQNLLAFMAKKHHNIADAKKAYNDNVLLNEARNPETPIYLSYTSKDLQKVGGESQRHAYAIYYALGSEQPIGAITLTQLVV